MFDPSSLPAAFVIHECSIQFSGGAYPYPAPRTPTVLVIDDDIDNLMLVSYVLEQFDCLFVCETDGQEALARVEELKPDLIILDIRLPNLSGLDIVRTLRRHSITRNTPVIAVTALASPRDRERILQAGCSQYVSKPYLLENMKTLLSRYLTPAV